MRQLRLLFSLSLLTSGLVHIAIAPTHYEHAPAHGLFFGGIGLVQLGYAVLCYLRPRALLRLPGLLLSGGMIVLWAATHVLQTPFASEAHAIDWAAITTKVLEGIACVSVLALDHIGAFQRRRGNPAGRLAWNTALALLGGMLLWGTGLALAPVFPALAETAAHSHAGHSHVHAPDKQSGFASSAPSAPDSYDWKMPADFPRPYLPVDNPMSAEKVELGRYLFYDRRLSANDTMSCGSCHVQSLAFTDGKVTPQGSTGETLLRNSPGLGNVAYYSTLTWANPVLTDLERQIVIPMFAEFPVEMGITGHEQSVINRFRSDTNYQRMFAAAFPEEADPFSWGNIVKALASFCRSLITNDSPYDRYLAGDAQALSESAQRGMQMFFSEELECHHCHGGFNFTGSTRQSTTVFVEAPFHNTGLYNLDGRGAYPSNNTGVAGVSNREEDMGRFRAPSLRNVALTAPYMHDGSVASLEEVLRLYEAGGRQITSGPYAGDGRRSPLKSGLVAGFHLTDQQRADLLAFLEALTDETFTHDPRFSDPFRR